MSRKAKKAMAVALTAGMLASTAATPVMAATEGWKQNTKGWWYQNADGSYPANKWEKINGKWYYFDANGYMVNGWKSIGGKWYYFGGANDGAMKSGWQPLGGKWYYLGEAEDGSMKDGWFKDYTGQYSYAKPGDGDIYQNKWQQYEGEWFYLNKDGYMEQGGWITVGDKEYFLAADGAMQSDVITVDGKTYYLGDASDGSKQTGVIDIAGTKYTFDENGVCTDETVPAAVKHFDKKGNEIIPEIEVEEVAGLTGEITNAMKEFSDKDTSVVLAGHKAYFKVLVTGKDGKPVANTAVSVDMEYVQDAGGEDAFELKGLEVLQTDAKGYANFVVGTKSSWPTEITETSGEYALYELTATATATGQDYKTNLAFATLDLGAVNVLNDDKDSGLKVVPSENAKEGVDSTPYTYTIDGAEKTEYVSTQQVNAKGTTTNKVKVELQPYIRIPYKSETSVVDKYYEEVNQTISEYSVYQDGGSTSFKVEGIPAGLKYATLNFSSIDISEYTRVEIQTYEAGTSTTVGDALIIDGPTTQKNFGYQIPVQDQTRLDIVVKVVSEGQVDDDQNAGIVVTNAEGVFDTEKSQTTKDVKLTDAVTWSVVENKYSNAQPMDAEKAALYINETDKKYTAEGNTYSYQVPVYPYTGNAILTVKDENKKVVGYFTIPTENQHTDVADTDPVGNPINIEKDFKNVNVLVAPNGQAILVSADEAFNTVGTISQSGNVAEVNSEETGITALQAKIKLDSYSDEVNLTNNTVYTSVHWSPIPNAEEATDSEDFYALVGQNITIKAQLVDSNGNKVSQAGERIRYEYGENGQILSLGAVGETKTTATVYTSTTDANGQATIKLTSGDEQALVDMLHAESDKFNVQLIIGDTNVNNANLRWVEAGLSFTDKVGGETTNTLDGNSEVDSDTLKKDVGSNWIFGFEAIGETQDDTVLRKVTAITGLKVDVSKGGAGDIVTDGMDNGTAKVTSTKAGATTLTGAINENSVVSGTDVVFKVASSKDNGKSWSTDEFVNVGEGVPSINAALNLPITWGTVGTQIEVIAPKGVSMVIPEDGEETVYVKVTDAFGNEIKGKDIEVSVTYSNGSKTYKADANGHVVATDDTTDKTTGVNRTPGADGIVDSLLATTDSEDGLVEVTLPGCLEQDEEGENIDFTPVTATVTARVGNETTQKTINYKKEADDAVEFAIGDIVYEPQTSSSNPKVRVIFTTPVNKDTLKKEMFTIKDSENTEVSIASVTVESSKSNEVVLTLGNQYINGLDNKETYTVEINGEEVDGITYELCDSYFRTFDGADEDGENVDNGYDFVFDTEKVTNTFTTADDKLDDARKLVENAVAEAKKTAANNAITADIASVGVAIATADSSDETEIDLSKVATKGSTVSIVVDKNAKNLISVSGKKITVNLEDAGDEDTAQFTVKVSKASGETQSVTYIITVDAGAYEIQTLEDAANEAIAADKAAVVDAIEAADGANTMEIDLSDVAESGSTVSVSIVEDGADIISVEDNVITIDLTEVSSAVTAQFKVTVSKAPGVTQSVTYTITATSTSEYTIAS